MKITFEFVRMPGDSQVESITVRTTTTDSVTALQQALAYVQGITAIPVERIFLVDLSPGKD